MACTAWNFTQRDTSRAVVCACASFSACACLILDAILASIFVIFAIGQRKHTA